MEAKQTAVEWLQKKLWQNNILTSEELELFEQANEMFEQQIIDAYETGDKYKTEISGEKYYNETYNK
jgi:DNA-binding ferritin-like protein (Dps family)